MQESGLVFDNSYVRDLPGFYVRWNPLLVAAPRLLFVNSELAEELGLDLAALDAAAQAAIFSGNALPAGAEPVAQVYAGHQFGRFSPQLGDGRALLLGEVVDRHGRRRDIAFKGSGRTPFARGGDGKAAVGPMLREALLGEAMHALGIPSTRALAVVATGEPVYRERALPGAVLTRVASSHLRIGTFDFFAARGDYERVRQLADYAIARHYPHLSEAPDRYLGFLRAVTRRQAALLAQWMAVGFIHGVMNTDNMSIAGETIDYGPCAFVESYDPDAVFSSIDQFGRYAYSRQPEMANWNLARLAETLLPLLADDEQQALALAAGVVAGFPALYRQHWLEAMRAKLGLTRQGDQGDQGNDCDRVDTALAEDWLSLLHQDRVDFTLAWRRLADAAEGNASLVHDLFSDRPALDQWLSRWRARCAAEVSDRSERGDRGEATPAACSVIRAQAMRRVSPWLIPRNHRVEEALSAASDDADLGPFTQLLAALRQPYEELPASARFAEPAADSFTASYRTFCGT